MTTIEAAVRNVQSRFTDKSDDDLYAELGLRTIAIPREPSLAGEFAPDIAADDFPRPPKAELINLGRRLFQRWERELYRFLCEEEKTDEKKRLVSAILGKDKSATAIVTGLLVSAFGLSPAIAVLVGALILRILVVPAGETICEYWSERLAVRTTA